MKLEKLVEKFIENDCSVIIGERFMYDPGDETIIISLFEDNADNAEWKKHLKEVFNFNLTTENLFTMSILHELGHHYTVDYFDNDEWCEQASEKCLENLKDTDHSEYTQNYFNMPIEKAATTWAVEYYRLNPAYMNAWNQRFTCALRHYEKTHGIKTSLLTKF